MFSNLEFITPGIFAFIAVIWLILQTVLNIFIYQRMRKKEYNFFRNWQRIKSNPLSFILSITLLIVMYCVLLIINLILSI